MPEDYKVAIIKEIKKGNKNLDPDNIIANSTNNHLLNKRDIEENIEILISEENIEKKGEQYHLTPKGEKNYSFITS